MIKQGSQLTEKEVFEKIAAEYDFEKILIPYKEGGTKDHPVERTWGMVVSWLHDKKRFPLDVIGAAIMLTVDRIKKEGHFKGTGKYGGDGRVFDHNLLATCDLIQKQRVVDLTYKAIVESRAPHMQLFVTRQVFSLLPWWVKMWTWRYWKYKRAVRKHGTS